jgi:hypothetical protein
MLCCLAVTTSMCGGNDDDRCELELPESDAAGGLTVEYKVSSTGNGHVSSLTYVTDDGPQVVKDPSLPFEESVTLATAHASISLVGRVSDGSLTLSYQLTGPDGPEQQLQTCASD